MLPYPNRIADHQSYLAFRKIIDDINSLEAQAALLDKHCRNLRIPTFAEIQKALQQGGSNPLNLTGLQPPCPPAGGGGTPITSFSDSLQTPDPSFTNGIGPNWLVALRGPQTTQPYQFGYPTIGISASGDGFNSLKWNNVNQSTPTANFYTVAVPIPTLPALFGVTQNMQVSLPNIAGGVNHAAGLSTNVYLADYLLNGYFWTIRGDGSWNLYRCNDDTFSGLDSGAAGAITINKPCRMSSDQSVAGQVTIKLTFNSVVISTVVDMSAQRFGAGGIGAVGTPGLHCLVSTATPLNEFRTFSCSTGL